MKSINELKPDFDRIIKASEESDKFLYGPLLSLKGIEMDKDLLEEGLRCLLEDFSLQTFFDDFFLIALISICRYKKRDLPTNCTILKKTPPNKEMLSALHFLYTYNPIDVMVTFKLKHHGDTTTLIDNEPIELIREVLLKKYIEDDFLTATLVKNEGIRYFKEYFKQRYEIEKSIHKRGRKRKYAGIINGIDYLQRYLQANTSIKCNTGITISREQAIFIYRFLTLLNIIEDNLNWERDNIRLILTKYRAGKY